jgi:cytochrome b561
MTTRSTTETWGSVTRTIHWVSAVLMIGGLTHGYWMSNLLQVREARLWHYMTHGTVFLYFGLLLVLRVVWRLSEPTPHQPAASASWEKFAAHTGHILLYALMIGLVISGYMLWSAFPARFSPERASQTVLTLFGWTVPGYYTTNNRDIFKYWEFVHEWMSRAMMVLVAVHIVAALRHHFTKSNDVLTRMTSGRVIR